MKVCLILSYNLLLVACVVLSVSAPAQINRKPEPKQQVPRAPIPNPLAQENASVSQPAQQPVLTLAAFEQQVIANHPLVKQALLYQQYGRAQLREAWGAFDPKIAFDIEQKTLGATEYYNNNALKFSLPVTSGINLTSGYESFKGTFVNPEDRTSGAGLVYGGVEVNVGQGLFFDSRRAGVLNARYDLRISQANVIAYANKVLFSARKEYWDWYSTYNEAKYLLTGVEFARQRYIGVREKVLVGEEAGIDTVEAIILYQDRLNAYQGAKLELQNAYLRMNSYLWNNGLSYQNLDTTAAPESFLIPPTVELPDMERTLALSPDLIIRRLELNQLDVDRRIAQNMLRPQADLKYQIIGTQGKSEFMPETDYLRQNFRLGAYLSFPLFLRKERGKLEQIKIKTEQARLELVQTERDIALSLAANQNTLLILREQITRQAAMVNNYTRLRDGELIKFSLGESSLFLVNTRETKLIESQIKQAELQAKFNKAIASALTLSGSLYIPTQGTQ
jgi:outer membrane protein